MSAPPTFREAFSYALILQATCVCGAILPVSILSAIVEVPHVRAVTFAAGIGAAVTVAAWSYAAGRVYYRAALAAGLVSVLALYLAVAR